MTITFRVGDVREQLAALPADHFDVVVTSPPYWGLRDYDVEGQIGLERTLGEHLEVLVHVFRGVRRVLKPTGVLWLNYGDCYATAPNGRSAAATKAAGGDDRTFRDKPFSTIGPVYSSTHDAWPLGPGARRGGGNNPSGGRLKPKDLCMVANRLAIALQDDGWWVRKENIWAKPNPMPESSKDRPSSAFEKVFMLTKSGRYSYDGAAVRVASSTSTAARLAQDIEGQAGSARANGGSRAGRPMKAVGARPGGWAHGGEDHSVLGFSGSGRAERAAKKNSFAQAKPNSASGRGVAPQYRPEREDVAYVGSRSLRDYEPPPAIGAWEVATAPFSDAHFATFPPELVERCLTTVVRSCCADCGKPLRRARSGGGWERTCRCPTGPLEAARVLDPFGGSGTVGMVADRLGLDCTLVELNADYVEIARRRLRARRPTAQLEGVNDPPRGEGLPLFGAAS